MKYFAIYLIIAMLLSGVAINDEIKNKTQEQCNNPSLSGVETNGERDANQVLTRDNQIVDNAYELIVPLGETYTIHGEHNYTGHVYINGTLNITPYDATLNTETGILHLNAPNIYINGIIDGRGRGYGGGGGGGGNGLHGTGQGGYGGINGYGGDGGTGGGANAGGGGGGSNGGLGRNDGITGNVTGGGNGGDGTMNANVWEGGNGGFGFGSGGGGGGLGRSDGDGSLYWGGGGGGGGGSGGENGKSGTASTGGNGGNGSGPFGGLGAFGNGDPQNGGYLGIASNNDNSFDFSVVMGSGAGGQRGFVGGDAGSGGGGGGAGGGAIMLYSNNDLIINGGLYTQGGAGGRRYTFPPGHGAGGGIAIHGINVSISGTVDAKGLGVGGTLKIFYHNLNYGQNHELEYGRLYTLYQNEKPMSILTAENHISVVGADIIFSGFHSFDPEGDGIEYKYDFGDGYSTGWLGTMEVVHSYSKEGIYNTTLLVRDEDEKISNVSEKVEITIVPFPQIRAEPISAKIGEAITFNASEGVEIDRGISRYYFDYGDGLNSDWISFYETIHVYNAIGSYYANLKVKNNDKNISVNSSTIRIDITETGAGLTNSPPKANLTVDSVRTQTGIKLCFYGNTSLDDDGYITKYYFDFGDGEYTGWLPISSVYHSYSQAGTYIVKLYVMDNGDLECEQPSQINISVETNQPPTPSYLQNPIFDRTTVALTWTKNKDYDFSKYEIHADVKTPFTPSTDTLFKIVDDQNQTNIVLENITNPSNYFYRLRTFDTGDLKVDSNIVPQYSDAPAITLIAPGNGAIINITNVSLSWHLENVDVTSEKLSFDLYLGKTSNPDIFFSDISNASFYLEGLDDKSTYYWYIKLKDLNASGAVSPIWFFNVDTESEAKPGDNNTDLGKLNLTITSDTEELVVKHGENTTFNLLITNDGKDTLTLAIVISGEAAPCLSLNNFITILAEEKTTVSVNVTRTSLLKPGNYTIALVFIHPDGMKHLNMPLWIQKNNNVEDIGEDDTNDEGDDTNITEGGSTDIWLYIVIGILVIILIFAVVIAFTMGKRKGGRTTGEDEVEIDDTEAYFPQKTSFIPEVRDKLDTIETISQTSMIDDAYRNKEVQTSDDKQIKVHLPQPSTTEPQPPSTKHPTAVTENKLLPSQEVEISPLNQPEQSFSQSPKPITTSPTDTIATSEAGKNSSMQIPKTTGVDNQERPKFLPETTESTLPPPNI